MFLVFRSPPRLAVFFGFDMDVLNGKLWQASTWLMEQVPLSEKSQGDWLTEILQGYSTRKINILNPRNGWFDRSMFLLLRRGVFSGEPAMSFRRCAELRRFQKRLKKSRFKGSFIFHSDMVCVSPQVDTNQPDWQLNSTESHCFEWASRLFFIDPEVQYDRDSSQHECANLGGVRDTESRESSQQTVCISDKIPFRATVDTSQAVPAGGLYTYINIYYILILYIRI